MLKGEKKGDIVLMPGSSGGIFFLVALNVQTQPRTALFEDLLSNGIPVISCESHGEVISSVSLNFAAACCLNLVTMKDTSNPGQITETYNSLNRQGGLGKGTEACATSAVRRLGSSLNSSEMCLQRTPCAACWRR